jgi:hypothetical protein
MYSLAASAAGVSLLALAQPAQAKIVYTPAHEPINRGVAVNIDLNHDGIKDFKIVANDYGHLFWIDVFSLHQNRIWGSGHAASALPAGARVGPNQAKFQKGAPACSFSAGTCKTLFDCSVNSGGTTCEGHWANATIGYLGLKFHIKGEHLFGWARLQKLNNQWVLTGYAYQTVPKKPIVTGKTKGADASDRAELTSEVVAMPARRPASLALLAMGSPALSLWRCRES